MPIGYRWQNQITIPGCLSRTCPGVPDENECEQRLDWLHLLMQFRSLDDARAAPAAEPLHIPRLARDRWEAELLQLLEWGLIVPETCGTTDTIPRAARYRLTESGAALVEWAVEKAAMRLVGGPPENRVVRPAWDRSRNELTCGGALVVRFHRSAPNQEAILDAFERARWPEWISDPLGAAEDLLAIVRLHDTVQCLNRRLGRRSPIYFCCDGTGRGVCWHRGRCNHTHATPSSRKRDWPRLYAPETDAE